MNDKCLVTVAIPTYNHARFIAKAIDSVLMQGVDDFELIILDNNSEDDTEDIVKNYLSDKRIQYIKNKENIGFIRNWGLANEIASGKYIATLHSDDFYYSGHLKKLLKLLEDNSLCSLAYTPCIWVDENDNFVSSPVHPGYPEFSSVSSRNELACLLAFDNYIAASSALVRKDVLRKISPPDPSLIHAADWDFWIRMAVINPNFIFDREPSVGYRVTDSKAGNIFLFTNTPLLDYIRIIEKVLSDKKNFDNIRGFEHNILKWLDYKAATCPIKLIGNTTKERIKNISYAIYCINMRNDSEGVAQLFIDRGSGFSETDSIRINNPQALNTLEFDLSEFKNIKAVRFDPLDKPVVLSIIEVRVFFVDANLELVLLPTNASISIGGIDYFLHGDPIFILNVDRDLLNRAIKISIKVNYIN